MRGRFIAFEGGEGSGKSTQAARLAAARGAVLTHEPGGTPAGRVIRSLLLDPSLGELDARAEALLLAADRAEHVAAVIRPALAAGRDVVSDRYAGSSLAYQGYGRGLALADLRRLSEWAADGLWPDLVIVLEVPPEEASGRRRAAEAPPDRLEAAGAEFHSRVAAGYRQLASAEPSWVVVDGRGSVEAVSARVEAAVRARLA
jgi:dTMP kinase